MSGKNPRVRKEPAHAEVSYSPVDDSELFVGWVRRAVAPAIARAESLRNPSRARRHRENNRYTDGAIGSRRRALFAIYQSTYAVNVDYGRTGRKLE